MEMEPRRNLAHLEIHVQWIKAVIENWGSTEGHFDPHLCDFVFVMQ